MPALAGEPWRGLIKVQLVDNVTGNGRYVTVSVVDVAPITASGHQAVWDYDPSVDGDGVAVTLRCEWDGGGAGAPGQIESITVDVRTPGASPGFGSVWTIPVASDSGLATRTFHFDTDPLNQALGTKIWGLFEIFVTMTRTSVIAYSPNSRGSGTVPAGTTHSWARGYLRMRGVVTAQSVSNINLGGAEPSIFAAGDQIHTRLTTGNQQSNAGDGAPITLSMRRPGGGASERSQGVTADQTVTRDWTWTLTDGGLTARISDTVAPVSEAKDFWVQIASVQFGTDERKVWAAGGHHAAFTRVDDLTLRMNNRITVDPRWTTTHHFQVDDNVFGLAKNVNPRAIRADQSGFLWARLTNARGGGILVPGASALTTLDPEAPGSTLSQSSTFGTLDGQTGWTLTPLEWVVSKPGGNWDKITDLTGPSDQDADTHQIGAAEQDYGLQVQDPNLRVATLGGDFATPTQHWYAGKQITLGGLLTNIKTLQPINPDGPKFCMAMRPTLAGPQYLDVNYDWQPWTVAGVPQTAVTFPLIEFPVGTRQFVVTISGSETALWGSTDFVLMTILTHGGFPYAAMSPVFVLGSVNQHDSYKADGAPLLGLPGKK